MGYYPDRSSSLSRVSSSFGDFQVYNSVQRPWQSSPDLRLEKWKPSQLCLPAADGSLDVIDVLKKKKHFLAELFKERSTEDESYRYRHMILMIIIMKLQLIIVMNNTWLLQAFETGDAIFGHVTIIFAASLIIGKPRSQHWEAYR